MIELIELLENTAMPAEERISLAVKLATDEFARDLSLAMSMAGKPPTRESIVNDLNLVESDARAIGDHGLACLVRTVIGNAMNRYKAISGVGASGG